MLNLNTFLILALILWIFGAIASSPARCEEDINQLVSPDVFGELVDIVTPGYLHWSSNSGDTVDPDADRKEQE